MVAVWWAFVVTGHIATSDSVLLTVACSGLVKSIIQVTQHTRTAPGEADGVD